MRFLAAVFATLCWAAVASAVPGWGTPGNIESTGGPDAYGYTWIDSDEAGGPTYNWVDISTVGTPILGLGDDNFDPTPHFFGFQFPYYWYTVNKLFVGSNGFVTFDAGANVAATFPNCPSTAAPNNLLHVNTDDWDFTADSSMNDCWFYTNGVDSVVVTWDSVRHWNAPTSLASFQVILCAADSSITYQYRIWLNNPGPSTDQAVIGIEDVTGTIGLEYWQGGTPAPNNPTANTALRFHPEPDPAFQLTDLAVEHVQNTGSYGFHVNANTPVNFHGYIKNSGTTVVNGATVRILVVRVIGGTVYNVTDTISTINPGEIIDVDFGTWPGEATPYEYRVTVQGLNWASLGDQVAGNNSKISELRSVVLSEVTPTWFEFYTGALDSGQSWQGSGSGYGMKYSSPTYPIVVTRVESGNFSNTGTVPGDVRLYAPDGPGGMPGTILFTTTIMVDTGAWRGADCNVWIGSGPFYVGFIQTSADGPATCFQSTTPISRNAWEYTGSWAPSRDGDIHDVALRANVRLSPVDVPDHPVTIPTRYDLYQNLPNPFNPVTVINYALPERADVRLDVYNVLGQRVTTLVNETQDAGYHSVAWDGSGLASGVYFYRVQAGGFSKTMKMTLLK